MFTNFFLKVYAGVIMFFGSAYFAFLRFKWWLYAEKRFTRLIDEALACVALVQAKLRDGEFENALDFYTNMVVDKLELEWIVSKYNVKSEYYEEAVKQIEGVEKLFRRMLKYSSAPILRTASVFNNGDDLDQILTDLKAHNKEPLKTLRGSETENMRSRRIGGEQ